MKIALAAVFAVILVFVVNRAYSFFIEERQLGSDLLDIQSRLTEAQTDEAALEDEMRYLANPVNLEKELRARFNYKKPGETMIVIVPPASSTGASSSRNN